MRDQMLKMAGAKNMKDFYKKFPTEEAFMKMHGKEFKKAQRGITMPGTYVPNPQRIQAIKEARTPTADSSNYLGNRIVAGINQGYRNTGDQREWYLKQVDAAARDLERQKLKGKPGYDKNGFPLSDYHTMPDGTLMLNSEMPYQYGGKLPKYQFAPGPISSMGLGNGYNPSVFMGGTGQPNNPYAIPQQTSPFPVFQADPTLKSAPIPGIQSYNPTPRFLGGEGYVDPDPYKAPEAGKTSFDAMGAVKKVAGGLGGIIGGAKALKAENKARKKAKQNSLLSDVMAQAAETPDQLLERKYVRPEDIPIENEQLFPSYGVGTNYLAAQHGAEIQNTYAPNTLYNNLGYEPMNESDIKQYCGGGKLRKATFGISQFAGMGGGDVLNQGINTIGGENAGGQLGSSIGGTVGSIFGPVGQMLGAVGGNVLGRLIDTNPRKIKQYNELTNYNMGRIAGANTRQGLQHQFSGLMEHGGYMNPEYNPRDIIRNIDQYRTGGHIRQNSAMQGELRTMWGGYPEYTSTNPFMPGGGESVIFRGNAHNETDGKGNTGIGVTYGQNPVEVERGEPAQKMQDGNLVVYGDLKIPDQFLSEIGDKDAKGKKFKNYVAGLNKKENRLNKIVDRSMSGLDGMEDFTNFDKLKAASFGANMLGSNMKLKAIAAKKQAAADVQEAINATAREHGIVAADFAKGKIKDEKMPEYRYGGYAQNGTTVTNEEEQYLQDLYEKAEKQGKGKDVLKFQQEFHRLHPEIARAVIGNFPVTNYGKDPKRNYTNEDLRSNEDSIFKERTKQYWKAYKDSRIKPATATAAAAATPAAAKTEVPIVPPNKHKWWIDAANSVLPYLRPSDQEGLDYSQLLGESYALADKVEPVQAQFYHPQLDQPYDISLQDQMNANQSDYNALARMTAGNPAAQAQLQAQKYAANSKVLGEQFRMNQAMKAGVYSKNRDTLNQAQLQNLGIADQQMVRQETAKSRTKDRWLQALNSVGEKLARNKLENRTLGVMENMYNFRYDKEGRAINMNPLQQYDVAINPGANTKSKEEPPEGYEWILKEKKKAKEETARNGSIVRAYRNL